MKLQTLYKPTKTGKTQQIDIEAIDDKVIVTQGQVDGKKQQYVTVCKPKNVGKANATTAQEQAVLEAKSKHAKKIKSGYSTELAGVIAVQLPQKVKSYQDQIKNVIFPCYSTPKLNGVNAIYWLKEDGSLLLTSRGGEEYPAIPHLEAPVKLLMSILDTDCLNGELYIHGEHLQDIQSAVKKPKLLSKHLRFEVFELPHVQKPYYEKAEIFKNTYETNKELFGTDLAYVGLLIPTLVISHDEIEAHWDNCVNTQKLEGTVIYNREAIYSFNQRNSNIFKYKKTLDAEYRIVSYELDKNEHPVFTCCTPVEAKLFKVKPKGTDAERKQIVLDFDEHYKGKFYKIEYETLSKAGVPLKPVGIGLRHCDEQGEPLE